LAAISVAVMLGLLAGAAPALAAPVFSDGFESGDFSAWSQVQTAGDGTAAIQSAVVRTGAVAAQLSESANAGSKAYLRKTFSAAQQDITATGDFQVVKEGASGGNVPFFRFLDPASARVVSVFRQNATGALGVTFANGTRGSSTAKLALGTWASVAMHVITNGASSTVQVSLNGTQVFSTTTAPLGAAAGVSTIQIGNDTASQAFTVVADTIDVQSGAPASPSPPVNTVPPTISGAPQVGQTLTATTGTWTGSPTITYAYQWRRCDSAGSTCVNVGTQANTYAVTGPDTGTTIRVIVTATNGQGGASATSNQTTVVSGTSSAPVNSSPPTITGTPQVGQTLSAGPGAWTGTQPMTFAYAWQRCDSAGTSCAAIAGATTASYTVAAGAPPTGDEGATLRVVVTASNGGGMSSPASSNPTAVVTASPATPAGLVALWHMDETSGTVMNDSARTHNGTLKSVQLGQPGFAGLAYGFTGASQVTVPSAADLNPGAATVTVTIHLKATSVPATPDWDLIRKGVFASAGGEFKMEYQPSGQASCGFNGSSGYSELMAGPALNNGQWHTVQCVKTATQIKVVVDGVAFTKAASLGTIGNTDAMAFGAHPNSEFFKGSLDEASLQIG
ncbi:MAG: hypothetical protein QOG35_660, partial [Solirubrobacteraceae bacterium]|nr:hypothetical protein [Solirubrobacteraceae bacterium]